MSVTTIYRDATVFTGDAAVSPRESFAVRDGRVLAAGELAAVRRAAGADGADRTDGASEVTEVSLGGAVVTPGIVEGHAHMLMLGESLAKVQLRDAASLTEVQERLAAARQAAPDAPRILGTSWMFDIFPNGERPTAAVIDAVISDVPVILDANDLHSVWVNTAALEAMGITRDTPNPVGGEIVRDAEGNATGFLLETAAMHFAWGYLDSVRSEADQDRYLSAAFDAYLETGVTAATEMSFGEAELATYRRRLARDGRLPFPITAHWLLTASGDVAADVAQIARIAQARDELAAEFGTQWLQIVGVKFILDGVIDACTATMRAPYANGALPGPIWEREFALPVAVAADAAGLQLALHAIGDEASTIALDMVQECVRVNGARADRRPRVEHLESVADDTIARMAALGVTASMQPVHCDPAVLDNWQAVLGDERAHTGFPWHKFRAAGVLLALGTDAPTAPHFAPDNLFIALTAASALDRSRAPYQPERVFTPAQALEALTLGAATATRREHEFGRIATGARANVAVWAVDPLAGAPEALLGSGAALTLVDGDVAHRREA
ncbi:amidohydrolase [Leucobacter chromiireducens]|uniref:Amidohydrolase n=1 Tax=Leucobacter chromiireducens subsp. solipictus TaxID=398235 RepID=A0ABS1SHY0_9MICO|nr:amidohydrolase [Leucobacter chromiireducens]MBL3680172.1 amidohydrolase [Leucobacter chromiireducens subsp. solipictus]